jgi:hypothetical protein
LAPVGGRPLESQLVFSLSAQLGVTQMHSVRRQFFALGSDGVLHAAKGKAAAARATGEIARAATEGVVIPSDRCLHR